jgi:hypothetical protein
MRQRFPHERVREEHRTSPGVPAAMGGRVTNAVA